jgi:hypothetical protein
MVPASARQDFTHDLYAEKLNNIQEHNYNKFLISDYNKETS